MCLLLITSLASFLLPSHDSFCFLQLSVRVGRSCCSKRGSREDSPSGARKQMGWKEGSWTKRCEQNYKLKEKRDKSIGPRRAKKKREKWAERTIAAVSYHYLSTVSFLLFPSNFPAPVSVYTTYGISYFCGFLLSGSPSVASQPAFFISVQSLCNRRSQLFCL